MLANNPTHALGQSASLPQPSLFLRSTMHTTPAKLSMIPPTPAKAATTDPRRIPSSMLQAASLSCGSGGARFDVTIGGALGGSTGSVAIEEISTDECEAWG